MSDKFDSSWFGSCNTDNSDNMWKTTTTYLPVIKQYRAVKGLPSDMAKQVTDLINEGWYVHGLPQKMTMYGTDLLVQCMVQYETS